MKIKSDQSIATNHLRPSNMIRGLTFICVVLCFSTVHGQKNNIEKIIGRNNAKDHEFPYTVSVRLNGKHLCGGAIISNRHILTAATCFRYLPEKFFPRLITVVSGTNYLNHCGQTHQIKGYVIHPKYEESIEKVGFEWDFDIAVITVSKPIEFNEYQQKINLPNRKPPVNRNAVVSAWGFTEPGSKSKLNNLQTVTLRILSRKNCQSYFRFTDITDSIVCGIRDKPENTCSGDLGSPLVFKSKIIGVVASGLSCKIPDIYTNVYTFLDQINAWIK